MSCLVSDLYQFIIVLSIASPVKSPHMDHAALCVQSSVGHLERFPGPPPGPVLDTRSQRRGSIECLRHKLQNRPVKTVIVFEALTDKDLAEDLAEVSVIYNRVCRGSEGSERDLM